MSNFSRIIKGRARSALHGKYGVPMVCLMILVAVYIVVSSPFNYSIMINQQRSSMIIYAIANILLFLVLFEAGIGFTYINLKIARNQRPAVSDLIYAFRNRPDRFISVFLVKEGIFFICLLPSFIMMFMPVTGDTFAAYTAIGAVLSAIGCIVGVILTVRFTLTELLMIDHPEYSGMDALRKSMSLMKGRNGSMIYIYASFIGYSMLCILSFNIGFLWVVPYMSESVCCFYLDAVGETFYRDVVKDPVIDVSIDDNTN